MSNNLNKRCFTIHSTAVKPLSGQDRTFVNQARSLLSTASMSLEEVMHYINSIEDDEARNELIVRYNEFVVGIPMPVSNETTMRG